MDSGGDNAHEAFTMLSVVDTTAGTKLADVKIDGDTLEAMALETSGSRLFLNNPAKNEVEVIDRKTNKLTTSWPVKLGKDNSTMAFDESAYRLFVGCRSGQMVVFNTQAGKELQALAIGRRADDLVFDPASKRIHATSGGAGVVNVYKEIDPDHYQSLGQVPSGPGGKDRPSGDAVISSFCSRAGERGSAERGLRLRTFSERRWRRALAWTGTIESVVTDSPVARARQLPKSCCPISLLQRRIDVPVLENLFQVRPNAQIRDVIRNR